MPSIHIPDYRVKTAEKAFRLLYQGHTLIDGSELEDVHKLLDMLGISQSETILPAEAEYVKIENSAKLRFYEECTDPATAERNVPVVVGIGMGIDAIRSGTQSQILNCNSSDIFNPTDKYIPMLEPRLIATLRRNCSHSEARTTPMTLPNNGPDPFVPSTSCTEGPSTSAIGFQIRKRKRTSEIENTRPDHQPEEFRKIMEPSRPHKVPRVQRNLDGIKTNTSENVVLQVEAGVSTKKSDTSIARNTRNTEMPLFRKVAPGTLLPPGRAPRREPQIPQPKIAQPAVIRQDKPKDVDTSTSDTTNESLNLSDQELLMVKTCNVKALPRSKPHFKKQTFWKYQKNIDLRNPSPLRIPEGACASLKPANVPASSKSKRILKITPTSSAENAPKKVVFRTDPDSTLISKYATPSSKIVKSVLLKKLNLLNIPSLTDAKDSPHPKLGPAVRNLRPRRGPVSATTKPQKQVATVGNNNSRSPKTITADALKQAIQAANQSKVKNDSKTKTMHKRTLRPRTGPASKTGRRLTPTRLPKAVKSPDPPHTTYVQSGRIDKNKQSQKPTKCLSDNFQGGLVAKTANCKNCGTLSKNLNQCTLCGKTIHDPSSPLGLIPEVTTKESINGNVGAQSKSGSSMNMNEAKIALNVPAIANSGRILVQTKTCLTYLPQQRLSINKSILPQSTQDSSTDASGSKTSTIANLNQLDQVKQSMGDKLAFRRRGTNVGEDTFAKIKMILPMMRQAKTLPQATTTVLEPPTTDTHRQVQAGINLAGSQAQTAPNVVTSEIKKPPTTDTHKQVEAGTILTGRQAQTAPNVVTPVLTKASITDTHKQVQAGTILTGRQAQTAPNAVTPVLTKAPNTDTHKQVEAGTILTRRQAQTAPNVVTPVLTKAPNTDKHKQVEAGTNLAGRQAQTAPNVVTPVLTKAPTTDTHKQVEAGTILTGRQAQTAPNVVTPVLTKAPTTDTHKQVEAGTILAGRQAQTVPNVVTSEIKKPPTTDTHKQVQAGTNLAGRQAQTAPNVVTSEIKKADTQGADTKKGNEVVDGVVIKTEKEDIKLNVNIRRDLISENNPIQCPECGMGYANPDLYDLHICGI